MRKNVKSGSGYSPVATRPRTLRVADLPHPATHTSSHSSHCARTDMRFDVLPPTVLEKLGLDDDFEAIQSVIAEEVAHTSRIASNTSLKTAFDTAYDVVAPPSPAFTLLVVYVVLSVVRVVANQLNARSRVRSHDKIL